MSILLSHLACCLMVAYTPAMTPNAHGSSPLLAQFTPTFDGEQALPNPALIGVVVAGPNAAPPGPFYAPRLICTAVAQLGEGIELAGRMIERCSVLVSNAAGNVTGTLAWHAATRSSNPGRAASTPDEQARLGPRAHTSASHAFGPWLGQAAHPPRDVASLPDCLVDGLRRPHRPQAGRAQLRLRLRRGPAAREHLGAACFGVSSAASEDAGRHRQGPHRP